MSGSRLDVLRRHTRARVAIGRAGDGQPTRAVLEFQLAHAMARDAVHGAVDFGRLAQDLAGYETIRVSSAATDRSTYLRRPDLGRVLGQGQDALLEGRGPYDLAFVVADGLSSLAVERYAVPTLEATRAALPDIGTAPVVLASQARVALGDDIAAALNARIVVVLIGERPGLSAADSLGAYLTFGARRGTPDSARNCVSNIHAHGLPPVEAARKIAWLARSATSLGFSGVALKEDSDRVGTFVDHRVVFPDPRA